MPLLRGEVVFAPGDCHLLLHENHIRLTRGPRENNFRPAIDPLFRSAAVHHGSRAAAVVLSGLLDDGAAGLAAVAEAGGTCLVEEPGSADFPDMPKAALRAVPEAAALEKEKLGEHLAQIAGAVAGPSKPVSEQIKVELMIASLERNTMSTEDRFGELTPLNCPDCNGVLWQVAGGPVRRYRCHTGHAFTEQSLSAAQEEALERSLYDSLRAHRGRAELLRRMAEAAGDAPSRDRLQTRAESIEQDAELIENALLRRDRAEAVTVL
jgi:two-component system chemotaxis response regulator CheB